MAGVPYWRLASFYGFYYAVLGAFSPYFSLYLEHRGLSPWWISVLMSLWYVTRVFVPSLWGAGSEQANRPVIWLRAGSLLVGLFLLIFLMPTGLGWMLVAMLGFSILMNGILPQFEALTLSHLGKNPSGYGRIRLWGSVGFLLVVIVYGFIFQQLDWYWLIPLMLPLVLLVWVSAQNNDFAEDYHSQEKPGWDAVRAILQRKQVKVFFLSVLLMQLSFGPFYVFYSLYLERHGYQPAVIGAYWALGVLAEIIVLYYSRYWLTRFSATRVVQFALLLGSIRWLLVALYPEQPVLMALVQIIHAINFGAFFAACMVLVQRFFPGRLSVHGQGILYGFSSGVGGVLGALLAGLIWETYGGNATFVMGAAASLLGFLLSVWFIRPRKRQLHKPI